MESQLEHANLRVRSIEETLRFLSTAMPGFRFRGGKKRPDGRWEWVHVGTSSTYLCLNEDARPDPPDEGPGLNHLGFVVEDTEAVRKRLEQAGYPEGFVADPHPHRKRIYFVDGNAREWEFVQYTSDDPAKRNDYSDIDG